MFCYVWEFRVHTEHVEAFVEAYGDGGAWVRLFRTDRGYVRTDLLRDRDDPSRFLTIDVWTDRSAFEEFRRRVRDEFDALDRRCEHFTIAEKHLGDFEMA